MPVTNLQVAQFLGVRSREERLEDLYLLPEISMDGIPSQELLDLHKKTLDFITEETRKLRDKYKPEEPE